MRNLENDYMLEEITLNLNPSKLYRLKQTINTHRCTTVLTVLVVLLSLALMASIGAFVLKDTNNAVCEPLLPEPSVHQQNFVALMREYKIKLNNTNEWKARSTEVGKYLEIIANVSSLRLSVSDIKGYVYDEYHVDGKHCHDKEDVFRVRQFFYPENLYYNTTIDIKKNNFTYDEVCTAPLWPADSIFTNSSQRCEYNVHSCANKYSRNTKVTFGEPKKFTTCGDLVSIYPWALKVDSTELLLPVPQKKAASHWWQGKSSGYLSKNTKYEIEFTLSYDCVDDAIRGHGKPNSGSFSLHIYAMDDGFAMSQRFDEVGLDEAEAIWNALLPISAENSDCEVDNMDMDEPNYWY